MTIEFGARMRRIPEYPQAETYDFGGDLVKLMSDRRISRSSSGGSGSSQIQGSLRGGDAAIHPLRSLGSPVEDMLSPTAYMAHQRMFDPAFPTGSCYYTKAAFLADLVDDAIEVFAEYAATKPSPLSGVLVQTVCGAASRVASDAMAFPHRAFPYAPVIVSQWTNPAETKGTLLGPGASLTPCSPSPAEAPTSMTLARMMRIGFALPTEAIMSGWQR